jgi:hypothetical protein
VRDACQTGRRLARASQVGTLYDADVSEGRLHPRLRIHVIADVIGSEVMLARSVDDISMGGIRFAGPAWEPEQAQVKLVLGFPDSGAAVAVEGRVVRSSATDMGVRFVDMSDEQKWALRKHVREAQGR